MGPPSSHHHVVYEGGAHPSLEVVAATQPVGLHLLLPLLDVHRCLGNHHAAAQGMSSVGFLMSACSTFTLTQIDQDI